MQWRNRGCAVGGRLERLQALFREGNAGEPGTLIVAVGLIPVIVLARVNARIGQPVKRRASSGGAPAEIGAHI